MAGSTLDPDNFPSGSSPQGAPRGHDLGSLGPSDSSDSGSDVAGLPWAPEEAIPLDRPAAEGMMGDEVTDIDTDRVVDAAEAGLGGLEQADEADSSEHDIENRRRQIAKAAYYRAERRGFVPGYEDDDWLGML